MEYLRLLVREGIIQEYRDLRYRTGTRRTHARNIWFEDNLGIKTDVLPLAMRRVRMAVMDIVAN